MTSDPIAAIRAALPGAMLGDRPALQRRLDGILRRQRQGKPFDRILSALRRDLARSVERRQQRQQNRPRPRYPDDLPVSARRADIAEAIAANQVVVVAGETGSGKTTQLPKICLELGRGVAGLIGHTQPRRIAARSVAARIATELETDVGQAVGYQVRFQDRVGPNTYIKLMTDGILLAETQSDPQLLAYDTLIIDEAHERSLNIDFLLGYLKQLLAGRSDLKLVITSATIDTERFATHFDAPVVQVSGRTYPVEMRYRPLGSDDPEEADRSLLEGVVAAVDELSAAGPGDVLVFLSGEREIREAAEALRKHHPPRTEILPLFARLSVAEQNRVFEQHGGRRIVLATNVAETSLTVPGIRYVVDAGLARISRYSHRSKVQRLPVEKVSQASANQRAGRCGRVGPGICVRLYDEDDFLARPPFTEPEIQRTNLAAVMLRMLDLGLGDVQAFPFVDPPDRRFVSDGYRVLAELGAVDEERRLTPLGRELARLPVDPRIGRMLLEARRRGCVQEVLVIAAALTIQDPRERPLDAQQRADAAHARFADERSDFVALLNLWRFYHEQGRHLSRRKLRELCREQFLAYRRLREWHDLHQQLANQVKDMGFRLNEAPADYAPLHQALLSGLLSNIGRHQGEGEYLGAHGKRFRIFPGSTTSGRPKWIMAAEVVETARLYGRTVARIEPGWVEELAGDLARRSFFEPHWEKRPAQVGAYETVSLYGIDLVQRRRVNYGPVDPTAARAIFIREALVHGEYRTDAGFFLHNRRFVDEIESLEDKARRRDILVDEETLFAFYDERIPAAIYSGKAFEQWRRRTEAERPDLLRFSREALMRRGAEDVTGERFPDCLAANGLLLPLEYRFEPGHPEDGVTAVIPLPALNQLRDDTFQWLVPGLLEEKVTALIRSLPKAVRRNFVPAPEFAAACVQALTPGRGSLQVAVAGQLTRMTGVAVDPAQFDAAKLPGHLRMGFRIVDGRGATLGAGRELERLQSQLAGDAREHFAQVSTASAARGFERDDVVAWDFGDLPRERELVQGGLSLRAYPALVAEDGRVALRLLETRAEAEAAMIDGLCALFSREHRQGLKYLRRNLPGLERMCLRYAPVGRCEELREDLVYLSVRRALLPDGVAVYAEAEYRRHSELARGRLVSVANDLCAGVDRSLERYQDIRRRLKGAVPPAWLAAVADIRVQLEHLLFPGFLRQIPDGVLEHLPRYLQAVQRRLDRLETQPERDRRQGAQVEELWRRWLQRSEADPQAAARDPELVRYRWLLEELRVSLFAQELGTAEKVSVKRLEEQWQRFVQG